MDHLSETTIADLQHALDTTDQKTPAMRLIAAIAYKNGITQSELADWFDVERKTIYNWLTRLEERDLETAIRDAERPGRPRKLDETQRREFETMLHNPPQDAEYDVPAWSTDRVQRLLREQFDVDYSRPSCRRLMSEAGLRYYTPDEAAAVADPTDSESFATAVRNLGHVWMPE